MKNIIVISAANFFGGGTLSIFQDCLRYVDENLSHEYQIVALVHDTTYFDQYKNITFMAFPKIRKSYFHRVYYEYWYYRKLSRQLRPHLWLSLNDISSNVEAKLRAVYCHNPTPFKKLLFSDIRSQPQVFFFTLFYKYLYKINIKRNNYVIVQQDWLRVAFSQMFDLNLNRIIVAPPKVVLPELIVDSLSEESNLCKFCFPTFPRPFKNIEVIGQAVKILRSKGIFDFKVFITIDGSENAYASDITKKYGKCDQIDFIGLISRSMVFQLYRESDCLIFPSTLETWGLPISEFKLFNKPVLVADLPYAHETVGEYDKAGFFDPFDPQALAEFMIAIIGKVDIYPKHNSLALESPKADNWGSLFDILLR